jgi:eukaryotic-like serine/threonine-protein kinase
VLDFPAGRVVRKCLAKSPDDRWQSAGDLLSELEWIAETGLKASISRPVATRRRKRERLSWLAAVGLLLVPLVWALAHLRNEPRAATVVRFQIPAPDNLNFYYYQLPAVSPDGERIAFTAAASTLENRQAFRSAPECRNCDGDPRSRT